MLLGNVLYMLTLSSPVELLFLLCCIAVWTCVGVSGMFECFPIYVSVCFCLTVLVNCLLNAFTICVGEVTVFCLKVIVLFLGCVGVLFANPCIVFQRVCVLCF